MSRISRSLLLIALLAASVGSVQAAAICSGCERVDVAAATFLGTHDATLDDNSTFQHTDLQSDFGAATAFDDYFVFDIATAARGSISLDYTILTLVLGFNAALYSDAGSVCGAAPGAGCPVLLLGADLGVLDSDGSAARIELQFDSLAVGRYVLRVSGTTTAAGISAYSGQLGLQSTPEPGSLALLSLGLLGFAGGLRRRTRR